MSKLVNPIELNSARENSELIPDACRPEDASMPKSIKVHVNGFIRELQSYQLCHQCYLISYLPIESIDDYRDDSIVHRLMRVTSPAMRKLVLRQFAIDCQLMIVSNFSQVVHLARVRAGIWNNRDSD